MSKRILITGGSGDLGSALASLLEARGDLVLRFDPAPPRDSAGTHVAASVLDRPALHEALGRGIDAVVHTAAWHGIHEGPRDRFQFWDLNMTGTMNVLETMVQLEVPALVWISSTAVAHQASFYGETKRLGEGLVRWYARHRGCSAVVLRPPSFIPPSNEALYPTFADWAREFWGRAAMHVDDLARATVLSIDATLQQPPEQTPVLTLGPRDDIPVDERAAWDQAGPGTSFRKLFPEFVEVATAANLAITRPPQRRDIFAAETVLGYVPQYGVREMLGELKGSGIGGYTITKNRPNATREWSAEKRD